MDEANEKLEAIRARYQAVMAPLFFPERPAEPDIIQLFASLLRVVGMEDAGWDPYMESRAVLEDLNRLMQIPLPEDRFADRELTGWRLGLLFYTHVVEMSAPYEVLLNLLRFRLGKGYSPNPYYDFLTKDERKRAAKSGLFPSKKIQIIGQLGDEAGLNLKSIFLDFYSGPFRNAVAHSDFIFTDEGFRCRNDLFGKSFKLSFAEVDVLITHAKAFIGAFFTLEREARRGWGTNAGQGHAYDAAYKGVMEILADDVGLMNGFKVHWPNGSESTYRRTEAGIDMTNCMLDLEANTIGLMVGLYARDRDPFSPLVERGEAPVYTPLENGEPTVWLP
ncbi:hypothetical protein ASD79_05185 [Caulobacter sp. Root655]|uniref:hypothetical protein n=1 Tax=Caulobacter sp. Root655 TaxID=1736578 RepID=UPI0006FC3E76|nr:hypothetical protein [Caulobacter sp. Root655]KRA61515.1 hypothetical protein ASD79_05185 [Caulobacter sp. Root655]